MKLDLSHKEPHFLYNPLNWSVRKKVLVGVGILLLALLILVIPSGQKFLALFAITVISFGIVFFKTSKQIPVDFTPTFFLLIFVHNALGTGYSVFFMIFGYIIPGVLGWGAPDAFAIFYWALLYSIALMSPFFMGLGFILGGIILAFAELISASILNMLVGKRFEEFLPFTIIALLFNLVYFILGGPFLYGYI